MKELKISNSDKVAFVDDHHYDRLSQYTWTATNNERSIMRSLWRGGKIRKRKAISLAQDVKQDYEAMFDHKDRNPFNNQEDNLREATFSQNGANTVKRKNCSSKYKGVFWNKAEEKWQAQLCFNGKKVQLKLHANEKDAALAYNKAALIYFGEFAVLNDISQ